DLPRLPGPRGNARRDGRADRGPRRPTRRSGDLRRLVVDRPNHTRRAREAARQWLRAACSTRAGRAEARPASIERVSLSVLRFAGHGAREYFRADALPLSALLPELQTAVRAV